MQSHVFAHPMERSARCQKHRQNAAPAPSALPLHFAHLHPDTDFRMGKTGKGTGSFGLRNKNKSHTLWYDVHQVSGRFERDTPRYVASPPERSTPKKNQASGFIVASRSLGLTVLLPILPPIAAVVAVVVPTTSRSPPAARAATPPLASVTVRADPRRLSSGSKTRNPAGER